MISFQSLTAGYGSKHILQSLSAKAKSGEFIALIGPNGSGKSTLLKSLCGIISPSSGRITLKDKNIRDVSLKVRARNIAYLAQSREALPSCLLYTSPSPRDRTRSRMPSSA